MANKFEEQIRILELAHGDILDVWADIPIYDKRIDQKMKVITDMMLDIEDLLYDLGKEDKKMDNRIKEQIRILLLIYCNIQDLWSVIPIDNRKIVNKMMVLTDTILDIKEMICKLNNED